jgi:hypothetical protein
MALYKHAREITSPIAAYPTKALTKILWAVFQSSLYFCLLVVLHFNLPAVRVHPSSDEVIVIRIKLASAPLFMCKAVREVLGVKNCTAEANSTTGQARQAAVNMQARRAIEIPSFQICRSKEAPNAHAALSFQSLGSPNTTN